MPDIECEHCGGTEFYKEAGFFFCKGCQVQSQEVQEYVFDDYVAENRPKTKKVHNAKKEKVDNKITSWECYNYVLAGLTQELINLGANKKLKHVVKILWLRYLEKLQVFGRSGDELPKLQAVHSAMDGEIVYGKLAKKKRKRNKSSSSEMDATTLESSSMKHERIKKKRALVKAQYDDYTQKSLGTSSLHNETLTSLQTGSDKSSKIPKPISYNIYACKELNKRIKLSRYHRDKHRVDFEHNLKCHKITYRNVSWRYRSSPHILSLNKIYALLCLGVLIVKDKIQLSDILRFMKEGHVSFNCYSHFFPEEFSDKELNFRNFKKNSIFSNESLRRITLEMARFLQVDSFISTPSLIELCERYCKEMNLSSEICRCVLKFIARSNVKMPIQNKSAKVPNYEARVLSIILFVLKLLFGLDGVTESHLGSYSEILNKSTATHPKTFNIIDWLKYIEYRNFVMTQQHFSTNFFSYGEAENVDLALGTLAKKEYPTEVKFNADRDKYKQLLEKLKREIDEPESVEFPATLTPFLDYSKLLPKKNYLDILFKDFGEHTLTHILKPNAFLNAIGSDKPLVVNGGANLDWIIENVVCPKVEATHILEENRKFVTVKLKFENETEKAKKQEETTINNSEEVGRLINDFQVLNESVFKHNESRLDSENYRSTLKYDFDKIEQDLKKSDDSYSKHYNPYERFWVRFKIRSEDLGKEDFAKFFDKFPYNFRLVFKECVRIAEENEQDFFTEYQLTEHYLIYLTQYSKQPEKQPTTKDTLVANYLERCKHLW